MRIDLNTKILSVPYSVRPHSKNLDLGHALQTSRTYQITLRQYDSMKPVVEKLDRPGIRISSIAFMRTQEGFQWHYKNSNSQKPLIYELLWSYAVRFKCQMLQNQEAFQFENIDWR